MSLAVRRVICHCLVTEHRSHAVISRPITRSLEGKQSLVTAMRSNSARRQPGLRAALRGLLGSPLESWPHLCEWLLRSSALAVTSSDSCWWLLKYRARSVAMMAFRMISSTCSYSLEFRLEKILCPSSYEKQRDQ